MLLALESATELVGVALLDGAEVVFEAAVTGRRRHAETLAPLVIEAMQAAGLPAAGGQAAGLPAGGGQESGGEPRRLTTVAVDVGPGLFTGLRVGVAMAKGLAFAAGIGVVPVSSLQALAFAALHGGGADEVLAVVDARRGEVFAARFSRDPDGGAVPVARDVPCRYRPEELGAALPELVAPPGGGRLTVVGDGALRYAGEWALPSGVTVAGSELAGPPPRAVALLAAGLVRSGAVPQDPAAVEAVYLRDADARINWVTRHGAPADGASSPGAPTAGVPGTVGA